MLKLHVGDFDGAQEFYGTVFGASLAYDLGDQARVLTFPDGPGLILLAEDPDEDNDNASFVMQVADLQATQALAIANGATSAESFEGTPGGEQARSVRLFDPWGNGIEILQLG
jgi:predicted enzyme related to lactoylglutathione lyase